MMAALLAALVGACIGSLIANLAVRYPSLAGMATGRSACPSCGATLGVAELVPIVSWFVLGRRCRHCAVAISPLYPLVEAAAALLCAASFALLDPWRAGPAAALGLVLLAAAAIDLRHLILPDIITLPLVMAGLALAGLRAATLHVPLPAMPDLADAVIGAVAGGASFAAIGIGYRALRGRDGLGLGDAKLMAAAGAWLGWQSLPMLVLLAASATLLVALLAGVRGREEAISFGPALALAFWLLYLILQHDGLCLAGICLA